MANENYFVHERPEVLALIDEKINKVLDVGCGAGHFSASVKTKTGAEVWGIEPNNAAAAAAANLIDKVLLGTYDDVESLLPENYFDSIFFNDVLEHMTDPYSVLRKVHRVVKTHGRIYASIPNVLFIDSIKEVLITRDWRYTDAGTLDATHFRFFTRKSTIRMFEEAGWTVDKIVPLNAVSSWKWSLVNFFFLGYFSDFFPMQFGVVASKRNP